MRAILSPSYRTGLQDQPTRRSRRVSTNTSTPTQRRASTGCRSLANPGLCDAGAAESRSAHDRTTELILRYGGARDYLDQLIAFAEAARNELAPDSPLLAQYDYECWIAEIRSYQQFACQRCGTFVSAEPFGPGAYAVEQYTRVCDMCYDELSSINSSVQRRLARLAVYALGHPDRCAGLIVETQRWLHMDDWQLECELGIDEIGVARLALCPRPRPDHEAADIATLATIAGCSEAELRHLFTDEFQVGANGGAGERPAPHSFRLDTDEILPF